MSSQPPITVDEALRLFNEVSNLTVRDAQDNERFAESRSKPNQAASSAAAGASKRTSSSTNRTTPRGTEADLRRQLELSEAVMKKLHAKNKALTQELEELKQQMRNSGGNTARPANAKQLSSSDQLELESLRKRVVEQDALIKQMKQASSRPSSAHGKPPLANSSTNNIENNSAAVPPTSKLLEKRILQLQQQYDALMDVKLECIRDGESTGKVNKEVKSFFVSSRQKMMDDAAFHEAERVLLNEKIAKLENELIRYQQQK